MYEMLIDFTAKTYDCKNGPFSDKVVGIVSPKCYLTSTILETGS